MENEEKTTESVSETAETDVANNETVATETIEVKTGTELDIEKIETAIEDLKTAGEELFADEIKALETKKAELVAELEAKAKAEVIEVEEEATTVWDKVKAVYIGYVREPLTIIMAVSIVYLVIKQLF